MAGDHGHMIEHSMLVPTLDSLPQQLLVLDGEGTVMTVNRAWHEFRELNGLPCEASEGNHYRQVLLSDAGIGDSERTMLSEGIRELLAGRVQQFRQTYAYRVADCALWFELFAVALPPGQRGAVVSLFDVTQQRQSELDLSVMANHDPLTELPNRRSFELEAERALTLADRRHSPAALVFLDLDDFKAINDSLGHAAGDEVLQHVARRLQHVKRSSDLLARWGGDEFVLLLPDMADEEGQSAVERFRSALGDPMTLGGRTQVVRASFGMAFYPSNGHTLTELLSHADETMYSAKAAARGPRRAGPTRGRRRPSTGGSVAYDARKAARAPDLTIDTL